MLQEKKTKLSPWCFYRKYYKMIIANILFNCHHIGCWPCANQGCYVRESGVSN